MTEDALLVGLAIATLAGVDTGSVHANGTAGAIHTEARVGSALAVDTHLIFIALDIGAWRNRATYSVAGKPCGAFAFARVQIETRTAIAKLIVAARHIQTWAWWKTSCDA